MKGDEAVAEKRELLEKATAPSNVDSSSPRGFSREHVGFFTTNDSSVDDGRDEKLNIGRKSSRGTVTEFANLVNDKSESIRDGGLARMGRTAKTGAIVITALIYLIGVTSLITYACYVNFHSPTLGPMHTIVPVLLHVIGTGATVAIKVYYDWSSEVGHLESMHLIVRSRMWLFPGLVTGVKRVLRSELEAARFSKIPKLKSKEALSATKPSMAVLTPCCMIGSCASIR